MRPVPGAVLAAALVLALAVPGLARAASITYVGADGNVHLTSPDGTVKRQVTRDGTPDRRYELPSQADDGTIVAVGEGTTVADGIKFAHWLSPDGRLIETQPLPTQTGIVRIPALTSGQVSPDGRFYLYDSAVSPFSGGVRYSSAMIGRIQSQDQCGLWCANARVSPRYLGTSGAFALLDPYLGTNGVAVQSGPTGSPSFWFDFVEDDGVSSIDEAAGRLALESLPESTGSMMSVLTSEPPAALVLARYTGAPGSALPTVDCVLENYTQMPGFARLSPDGTMLAWQDRAGVYVSPVPPQTGGGTCTLQPRLIAPGGRRPDWGRSDVPAPPVAPPAPPAAPPVAPQRPPATTPRPSTGVGTAPKVAAPTTCRSARAAVVRAERRVAGARRSVRRWSAKLRTATKARRRAAARTARRKLASARRSVTREQRALRSARAIAKRRC
jgi:hypothetical protein